MSERDRFSPRHHGVVAWVVTALDDIFVEQAWPRLRRGDVLGAVRVVADVVLGFWSCAAIIVLLVAAAVVLIVLV